jgi:hypothetical protein
MLDTYEKGLPPSFPQTISDVPQEVRDAYEKSFSTITSIGYCHNGEIFLYFVDHESILYGRKDFYSKNGKLVASNASSEWGANSDLNEEAYTCTNIASKRQDT